MSRVFSFIPREDVQFVDTYSDPARLHIFKDIRFRTGVASLYNFHTPIGIHDSKIINITNKQLSFQINQYKHHIGDWYSQELANTYNVLRTSNKSNDVRITDPMFYFFDYECVNGWSHSFDCMFYLLYMYSGWKFNCKLLVVKSDNVHYNNTLALIKNLFSVEYMYIEPNVNYVFSEFYCVRNYLNVLFHEVKDFVNKRVVQPILAKYEGHPYFDTICKIKYKTNGNLNRLDTSLDKSDVFTSACEKRSIVDISNLENEELKIYLLNKATNIIVCWGSAYYININYYVQDVSTKFVSVLFHKNIMGERNFLTVENGTISQNLIGQSGEYVDQVYNTFRCNGEVIDSIDNLEDYTSRSVLLK